MNCQCRYDNNILIGRDQLAMISIFKEFGYNIKSILPVLMDMDKIWTYNKHKKYNIN